MSNGSNVQDVAATVQIIATVGSFLHGVSAIIEVDNNAPFTLKMVAHNHEHGGFGGHVLPHEEIPPHSAEVFGSQANANSIATGTTGSVSYVGGGIEMLVGWLIPFAGGNETNVGPKIGFGRKFGIGLGGPNASRFLVTHQIGNGNDKVHARFRLVRHPPYSLRQTLKEMGVPLREKDALENKGIHVLFPRARNIREILPNTTQRKL